MSTVLESIDVTSGYAGVPAIRGLDLHVDAGEVVALLGPNGAGKTTTLLSLCGILNPIGGEVRVLGESVSAGRPHLLARRGCAFVPDDRALFYNLSARDNLRLGFRRRHASSGVASVLEYFPALESRLSVRAGALSGGEQQMLALGRAIASEPKVLMVDELTLGLAPVVARAILPAVRQLADSRGVGVLLVEQHVDLALQVADRAYVLSHGEVALSGTASDLSTRRSVLETTYMGEVSIDGSQSKTGA